MYDPDLFDAELIVERYGYARFGMTELAQFLGISRMSVNRRLYAGAIPRPAIIETPEWGGTKCFWTPAQVAEMVLNAKPNSRIAQRVRVRA